MSLGAKLGGRAERRWESAGRKSNSACKNFACLGWPTWPHQPSSNFKGPPNSRNSLTRNMLTLNALFELLTEKGVLSKPEILERIKKPRGCCAPLSPVRAVFCSVVHRRA